MILHKIVTPELAANTYLLIDPSTKKGVLIDPTCNIDPIKNLIAQENCAIAAILETHVHADFISGSQRVKNFLAPKASIYASAMGGKKWLPTYCDHPVVDRQCIEMDSFSLEAWHTPGHTPEHIIWIVKDAQKQLTVAFTGDFLFQGSVGRPDLLGNTETKKLAEALYRSIFSVLTQLPDTVTIYPAHGAGSLCGKSIGNSCTSTLATEWANNPFLKKLPIKEWIKNLMENMPPAPQYFSTMKKLNVEGTSFSQEPTTSKKLSEKEIIAIIDSSAVVIDIRSKEAFARAHLKHSLNVPLEGAFSRWIPEIAPYNRSIVLVAENPEQCTRAQTVMQLVGLKNSGGFFLWEDSSFANFPEHKLSFSLYSPENTLKCIENDKNIVIVDVRTREEWKSGHISHALNLPLTHLKEQMEQLPKEKTLGIVCASGYRASIAISLLEQHGFSSMFNIEGGMNRWKQEGLPVEDFE